MENDRHRVIVNDLIIRFASIRRFVMQESGKRDDPTTVERLEQMRKNLAADRLNNLLGANDLECPLYG